MSRNALQYLDKNPGFEGVYDPPDNWEPTSRKPICLFAKVTPRLAAFWLENLNTHNRDERSANLEAYCRDRLDGFWPITPQGLGFGKDGLLLDGQHRLLMVVKTGKATVFLIVFGLDDEAQRVLDRQARRTCGEQWKLDGITQGNRRAAIIRALWGIATAFTGSPTQHDYDQMAEKHKAALDWIVGILNRQGGSFPRPWDAWLNAIFVVAWEKDKRAISEFVQALWDGAITSGSPAQTLRKYLNQLDSGDKRSTAKVDSQSVRLVKILRACYGHVKHHENLGTLKEHNSANQYYLANRRELLP